MTGLFRRCVADLIRHEGGLVDDLNDRGGVTKYGISLRFLKAHGIDLNDDGKADAEDIKELTRKQAEQIYWGQFWLTLNCDLIEPAELSKLVFEFGVNAGNLRAGKCLQKALRAAGQSVWVDGIIGPKTIEAIDRASHLKLTLAFLGLVLDHYRNARTWKHHGRGWVGRVVEELIEAAEPEFGIDDEPGD